MDKNDFTAAIYKELDLEEAISHRVHSRIFEILGYLDLIEKRQLEQEDQMNLIRVEDICKSLISELHTIIDFYKGNA